MHCLGSIMSVPFRFIFVWSFGITKGRSRVIVCRFGLFRCVVRVHFDVPFRIHRASFWVVFTPFWARHMPFRAHHVLLRMIYVPSRVYGVCAVLTCVSIKSWHDVLDKGDNGAIQKLMLVLPPFFM